MINVIFYFPDGHTEIEPEVHPRRQHEAIPIPKGAEAFAVYLATEPASPGTPIVAILGPDGRDTGRTLIGSQEVPGPAAPVGWGPEMGG